MSWSVSFCEFIMKTVICVVFFDYATTINYVTDFLSFFQGNTDHIFSPKAGIRKGTNKCCVETDPRKQDAAQEA